MIAGIFGKDGVMVSTSPGVTLTSASEVLLCNKAVESALPRLSGDSKAKVEDMFSPLGETVSTLSDFLIEAEGEEELSRLLDELDASFVDGPLEKTPVPVVGMDLKTGRFLEVILKKYAENEDKDLRNLSAKVAAGVARQIDATLNTSMHSGISFN